MWGSLYDNTSLLVWGWSDEKTGLRTDQNLKPLNCNNHCGYQLLRCCPIVLFLNGSFWGVSIGLLHVGERGSNGRFVSL